MQGVQPRFIHIPKTSVILSLALHGGLLLLFVSNSVLQSLGIELFPNKKKDLGNLYQSFVQVDVVDLPDELLDQIQNPLLPLVPNPKIDVVEPEKPDPEAMEQAEAKEKADAMAALKKKEIETKKAAEEKARQAKQDKALKAAMEEAKREQALKGLQSKSGQAGRGKIKGNIVSQGTSSKGMIGNAKDRYQGVLTETIKQHFNIFSWLSKKGLVAEVVLVLNPNGRVRSRRITQTSHDTLYDSAVLQAIDDAQPFPIPEDRSLLQGEITIKFTP